MAGLGGAANLGGVGDPRLGSVDIDTIGTHHDEIMHEVGPPDSHGHNTIYLDSSITFEDYRWWAKRARELEKNIPANAGFTNLWQLLAGTAGKKKQVELIEKDAEKKDGSDDQSSAKGTSSAEDKNPIKSNKIDKYGISEAEWESAQRAARTASWGAIFYLITTDILGPYSAPYAFSQLGYGPGTAIFLVFGVLSYYSGMQLWRMFCGLDSPRYPIRNYGDLAFRLFGNWARVTANVLQSFQFFLNVALCIVANGQGLVQMAAGLNGKGFLCFVVAEVIFTLIGFLLGQIRTLQRLGWLANLSVWLNIIVIFSTIAGVYIYGVNHKANAAIGNPATGPPVTSGGLPSGLTLVDNVNGMFNGVFAYGGATMFNELMAEMRRPYDFWKSLLIAETFITIVYMVFGLVVYSQQGNYTYNPTFQGISDAGYKLQTLGNAIYFIVSVIAALLYGNIGIKVFYACVFRDVFHFPALDTKKGKWTWAIFVPVYWGLAFILAAAVPQVSDLISFEGALTIMQFSYTFPPIFMVVYNCKNDSILPEEEYDPNTGALRRLDNGPKRWWRGFKKQFLLNSFDCVYFLGACVAAVLGLWASISGMVTYYKVNQITPFGCKSPAG